MSSPSDFLRSFRQWRKDPNFKWPVETTFEKQHHILVEAASKFGLPQNPLDATAREKALLIARADVAEIFAATDIELDEIIPPLEILLP